MHIRAYTKADRDEIIALFYNTVHTVNARDYSKEQLDAWTSGCADREKWCKSFEEHFTLVAEENGIIIGFGDIDGTGYLDRLYVHKDYQHKGVATALCDRLESTVHGDITTHASITAKPFLEKRGYLCLKEQSVEREGIYLTNYIMIKRK